MDFPLSTTETSCRREKRNSIRNDDDDSSNSIWRMGSGFVAENPDIVRAVNNAYAAEAQWVNANSSETEHIIQKRTNYSDQIRDQFIAQKRQYRVLPVTDSEFVAELQRAADWLAERKVLPETIKVSNHLASL